MNIPFFYVSISAPFYQQKTLVPQGILEVDLQLYIKSEMKTKCCKLYHELAISYNLYTNLDASEVIRTSEHAEGCRVNVHAFYHQQQLSELKRLAAEDPRPVSEIYDELASNVTTSLDTAAYFPSWDQARNTMYYSRAKR
ncbi:hypothetical protein T4D_5184 [Trichinella pseudospiralis]|uniref:Uncharacterized protein n=1 Tax=Trichinella pseudospiralis TaxID=6337 RepID=A0A0V1FY37_TRIPS|nr:hypothetical protein T4D_5184 [Trichinella pseudospiralis]